jgi:hypothetical protein
MKSFLAICIITISVGCSPNKEKTLENSANSAEIKDSIAENKPIATDTSQVNTELAIRHSTKYSSHIAEGLKELSDSSVFSVNHGQMIQQLDSIHRIYFNQHPELQLLSYSRGDLFQDGLNDFAFIVYDRLDNLISFLVFNDLSKDYFLLYQDLNVETGIKSDECYYGTSGTLDYQVASELVYLKESLIKKPESLSEYSLCMIGDIVGLPNILIDRGCSEDDYIPGSSESTLCIGTSLVYNNWDCLRFDKERNAFIIFFGQAFAD